MIKRQHVFNGESVSLAVKNATKFVYFLRYKRCVPCMSVVGLDKLQGTCICDR